MLSHANIVRFFGHRKEGPTMYLFLEYCSGGELFDRIGEAYHKPHTSVKKNAFSSIEIVYEIPAGEIWIYLVNAFQLSLKNRMWGCQKEMLTDSSCS